MEKVTFEEYVNDIRGVCPKCFQHFVLSSDLHEPTFINTIKEFDRIYDLACSCCDKNCNWFGRYTRTLSKVQLRNEKINKIIDDKSGIRKPVCG